MSSLMTGCEMALMSWDLPRDTTCLWLQVPLYWDRLKSK